MRLTAVILISTLLQVSASSFGQRLTLTQKNVSIEKVLMEIKIQTGYDVLVFTKKFKTEAKIDVDFKNAPIVQVMDKIVFGNDFAYSIEDKNVVIKEKTPSFLESLAKRWAAIDVRGIVLDEKGLPLVGATVAIKGSNKSVKTNVKGEFYLQNVGEKDKLVISYIGYQNREVDAASDMGSLTLVLADSKLDEVQIISTGYQNLSKDRTTGSFTYINNELLNKKVGVNILDRLDGVTSGLIFNRNNATGGTKSNISVRGRSTIFGNPNPLIVLDNFPYEGDVNSLNPNDIESITILKDAAAAAIWGTRAANGVIVISTKKGQKNHKPNVSFNTNLTIGQKPELYTQQQLNSKDFIEVEQFLFDKGKYNSSINNGYAVISPAVEIMLLSRQNKISLAKKTEMLDSLAKYDIRNQELKYLYQNAVNQQYQLSIAGGSSSQKYFMSAGFDKNKDVTRKEFNRFTLNVNNTYALLNDKLELTTGLLYTNSKINSSSRVFSPRYPYEHIADDYGNALPVTDGTLRVKYAETAGGGKLLDWLYRPLEEIQPTNTNSLSSYRLSTQLTYMLANPLTLSANYLYQNDINDDNRYSPESSYDVRNQINRSSQINPSTGELNRPLPLGDILYTSLVSTKSNYGRVQLIYNESFLEKHHFNGIAGVEIRENNMITTRNNLYGYNKELTTNLNQSIDFTKTYPDFYGSGSTTILTGTTGNGRLDHHFSYYANAAYNYNLKYFFSLSIRKDESNIFGVKANQKGVPLWSSGIAWNISEEEFYKTSSLPYLKFRFTYGYNGNVDNSASAYLTANYEGTNLFHIPYANIVNPPNPSLRWERVSNVNMGIDFSGKRNLFSGSIDYFVKSGKDLIGISSIAPQTGIVKYKGNTAAQRTNGLEIQLNTNILSGIVSWKTIALFNLTKDKITDYKIIPGTNFNLVNASYENPFIGHAYNAIYSYKWAGLDQQGNPQGYLNGEVSKSYTAIGSSVNREDLIYHGAATPTFFGGFLNSFSFKQIDLSFNIVYKAGYYFRRNSLDNSSLYNSGTYRMPDYENRWQKLGDELITNIPALVYPAVSNRSNLYTYSEILIEKGDHIRLNDIQLNIRLDKMLLPGLPFKQLNVYLYTNTLGLIWTANKYKIDPDSRTIASAKNISIGLKTNL